MTRRSTVICSAIALLLLAVAIVGGLRELRTRAEEKEQLIVSGLAALHEIVSRTTHVSLSRHTRIQEAERMMFPVTDSSDAEAILDSLQRITLSGALKASDSYGIPDNIGFVVLSSHGSHLAELNVNRGRITFDGWRIPLDEATWDTLNRAVEKARNNYE